MCCSAWPATFSKTITGTWEVLVDGKVNHVLWYQNNVGTAHPQREETLTWCVQRIKQSPDWFKFCQRPMRDTQLSVRNVVEAFEEQTGQAFPHPIPDEIFPAKAIV